jgi:hypothetical protein
MPETESPVVRKYIDIKELCARTPYAEKTIHNWVCNGTWKEGLHFFKPTARKLIFDWEIVERWIRGESDA